MLVLYFIIHGFRFLATYFYGFYDINLLIIWIVRFLGRSEEFIPARPYSARTKGRFQAAWFRYLSNYW